ncbi:MAG: cytochrome b/b6 domain-containing protein [Pseudomonadota bacterium]
MALSKTTPPAGYSSLQVTLHWATMVLVALQLIFPEGISRAFEAGLRTGELSFSVPVVMHFFFGSVITFLVMWRLMLRNERGVPGHVEGEPAIFQKLSTYAHWGFYIVLLLLPVTGALAWGMAAEGPGEAHEILKMALLVLIAGHVGAVIIHQFVWKTNILARMTKPQN